MDAKTISLDDHSVIEGDRISPLESYRWALEKKCYFFGVLCDRCDAPANFLCRLNGHVVPCTSCLHGKWVEDVSTDKFGILVNIVLCCL